jgi:archaemetzincin
VTVGVLWIGAGAADPDLLALLRRLVSREFGLPAQVLALAERPDETGYDPRRKQHSSRALVEWIDERRPAGIGRVLGLTDRDLFMPILTHVYGEAALGGRAAIVSTARMAEHDGAPADAIRVRTRTAKEGLHELGHTLGLLHCDNARCLMARAAVLTHVDTKTTRLCPSCRDQLAALRPRLEPETAP